MKKLLLTIWLCIMSAGAVGQVAVSYSNAGTTGTTLNSLATINSSNNAVVATTSQTTIPAYIVVNGSGTSGQAALAVTGIALCTMDSTISSGAAGYFVIESTATGGYCHPQAAAPSSGVWVVGYLAAAATTSGSTAYVQVNGFIYGGSGSGSGTVNNCGTADALAYYSSTGTAVNCDANLTDSPSGTLNVSGLNASGGSPAASTSNLYSTKSPFTSGTGTTNWPAFYFNQGGTAVTTWSANGTEFGFNAPSGFTGNMLDFHVNGGVSVFAVSYTGTVTGASFSGSNNTFSNIGNGSLSNSAVTWNEQAVSLGSSGLDYAAGGGTAQAQTVTLSPVASSLTAGLTVKWLPTAANSAAAPTLAVNSLTAKSITKCGTTALVANDLTTTAIAIAVYDGTEFQLINPQSTGCGSSGGGSAPSNLGALTYNASGTTTFAAASAVIAFGTVATTHSTSTTFSPTGLVAGGIYDVYISQDSTGGGVTFTLGTAGTCSAWKVTGGGSGAITLTSTASAVDDLHFTYDGTNCRGTIFPNQN